MTQGIHEIPPRLHSYTKHAKNSLTEPVVKTSTLAPSTSVMDTVYFISDTVRRFPGSLIWPSERNSLIILFLPALILLSPLSQGWPNMIAKVSAAIG